MTDLESSAIDLACGAVAILLTAAVFWGIARSMFFYAALKVAFLLSWGAVAIVGPLVAYVVVYLQQGEPIKGALIVGLYLVAVGIPFIVWGWPKLRALTDRPF